MRSSSPSVFISTLGAVSLLVLGACTPTPVAAPVADAPPAPAPAAVSAPAQAAPTVLLPAAKVRMEHLQVAMRDGARLDTDVYLPAAEGRFPTVLIRTPYARELSLRGNQYDAFLAAGYAIVQQHERGRFLSEGEMHMLGNAPEDGWDTLTWIAAQDWSDGGVAMSGCSSSAENQLKLSTLGHPALKAVIAYSSGVGIAEAGGHHEQGNFWRGGAWQMGWADYFYAQMAIHVPQLPAGLSDTERQRLMASFKLEQESAVSPADLQANRMHLPMSELGDVVGAPETDLPAYLARGPSHPAWADDRITTGETPTVPGLYAEALYDISSAAGTARFMETLATSPAGTQALMLINGQHCSYRQQVADGTVGDRPIGDMRFDYTARELAFLDHWLKGKADAPLPAQAVTVYMAGINRWVSFDAVPQAGTDTTKTFYLSSGGSANTLDGDGTLVTTAPDAAAVDTFTYDPADPVIAHGGQISGLGTDQEDGAYDQRGIEARDDVLVYTSDVLEADLPVFGFIHTDLFVSSDMPDTDFTVKLVDVAPDGTAWNITDTILRMRYREGMDRPVFMQPGETYAITPPPMLAGNVFLKGHRVRVEVSSSHFPAYARNLNTAGDPYTTTETAVATNRVHHGPAMLSRIDLPVVDLTNN
ncbi:CocE/NonD family hydrolase [Hyphomonas johnsonii]|uniref:Hydrolase n=1 Tax=Hyphomonas johnsonii MHS-2 TaxID=1280950 RepID=A0A059FVA3_9PROT|nr:CocE/NonD family hydrolase [Hyphomonas johnsonii]KCZ94441.1 hydrolase [Hyphomonas johnsonii MHS-2]